jgi:hypothetical protein
MIMMPYDNYRLYQIERAKHPAEIQWSDERAAHVASVVSRLFRPLALAVRAARRPYPATGHGGASRLVEPAA